MPCRTYLTSQRHIGTRWTLESTLGPRERVNGGFANLQGREDASCVVGQQSPQGRFVGFFTAVAMTSCRRTESGQTARGVLWSVTAGVDPFHERTIQRTRRFHMCSSDGIDPAGCGARRFRGCKYRSVRESSNARRLLWDFSAAGWFVGPHDTALHYAEPLRLKG